MNHYLPLSSNTITIHAIIIDSIFLLLNNCLSLQTPVKSYKYLFIYSLYY